MLNTKPYISIKPSRRSPFTPVSQRKGIAHPRDRIKFWNIQVGDKIGIFRGNYKPKQEGERDKVFEVSDVDKLRNLVEIKDLPVRLFLALECAVMTGSGFADVYLRARQGVSQPNRSREFSIRTLDCTWANTPSPPKSTANP